MATQDGKTGRGIEGVRRGVVQRSSENVYLHASPGPRRGQLGDALFSFHLVGHFFVSGTPGQNPTPADRSFCMPFLLSGMLTHPKSVFISRPILLFLRRRSCRMFYAVARTEPKCMYVCMYGCMYVCMSMYVFLFVCLLACLHVIIFVI